MLVGESERPDFFVVKQDELVMFFILSDQYIRPMQKSCHVQSQ